MADKRAEEFKALADFLADRQRREARNPVPKGYNPFDPRHKQPDPFGIRAAARSQQRQQSVRKARGNTRRA
ncbi:MAG: hypothetical protein HRJ53_09435 [Acidobacteria bacterium Pan2503]|uniref:Uncharacterized protein n=1 Tax=Candidatus Acidiferrum panamense TaxID=2741543 RepID=A0A7V8NPN3_9BACT|nr:hypothetical protein [Candidatus Acidoferrum panamensis]